MDISIVMKSGTKFALTVQDDLKSITSMLNKNQFVFFGPLVLNTSEIEYVKKGS